MGSEEDKLKRQRRRKRNFIAKQLRTNPLFKQQKIESKIKKQEVSKFRQLELEEELEMFKKGELDGE